MGTSLSTYELNHECATRTRTKYPWFITALNHGYIKIMFYFDSSEFVPLKCDALVFDALYLGIPIKFHFRRL